MALELHDTNAQESEWLLNAFLMHDKFININALIGECLIPSMQQWNEAKTLLGDWY